MWLIGVLALLAAAARRPGTRSRGLVPNPSAENAACAMVLESRPTRYSGRTQARGQSSVDWLARVAFHAAYGRWPTTSTVDVDRLAVLLTCVSAQTERAR